MSTCPLTTIWPEIPPHGVRLTCILPAGHGGECLAAEVEYLEEVPC